MGSSELFGFKSGLFGFKSLFGQKSSNLKSLVSEDNTGGDVGKEDPAAAAPQAEAEEETADTVEPLVNAPNRDFAQADKQSDKLMQVRILQFSSCVRVFTMHLSSCATRSASDVRALVWRVCRLSTEPMVRCRRCTSWRHGTLFLPRQSRCVTCAPLSVGIVLSMADSPPSNLLLLPPFHSSALLLLLLFHLGIERLLLMLTCLGSMCLSFADTVRKGHKGWWGDTHGGVSAGEDLASTETFEREGYEEVLLQR